MRKPLRRSISEAFLQETLHLNTMNRSLRRLSDALLPGAFAQASGEFISVGGREIAVLYRTTTSSCC